MDEVFQYEQEHLKSTYQRLLELKDELSEELGRRQAEIERDVAEMSAEVKVDVVGVGDDEVMEALASVETLNIVIDSFNAYHDAAVTTLKNIDILLEQPYFAKVRLVMRPGEEPRDFYIGPVGVLDRGEHVRSLVIDWRSPVAETYYNQETGETSYYVDRRKKTVELLLRRQFDIAGDTLRSYFDTTVAIQDALLLGALRKPHSEKLKAITATIQREQNTVVRHEDVPVLLVNGIAGSGKTSVMLQRIAFLLYRERETLSSDQVYLFTPNPVFESYIDTVLPSLGEANPKTFTWESFVAGLGLSERSSGSDESLDSLDRLEAGLAHLNIDEDDLRGISCADTQLLRPSQVAQSVRKYARFGVGPRFAALVKADLHTKLNRRITTLARRDDIRDEVAELDLDHQLSLFGHVLDDPSDDQLGAYAEEYLHKRYDGAHASIDALEWLRLDRIGMRILDSKGLSAALWLYLRILITGIGDRSARFVMIDEVQDYSAAQLKVLSRYFSRAHFLLLGDEHQAIRPGTASFAQIREIFSRSHRTVEECALLTSYRSSPEITEIFASLLDEEERPEISSVREAGTRPAIRECPDDDAYLAALVQAAREAAGQEGLTAIVAHDRARAHWIARKLGEVARELKGTDRLPAAGVIVIDLRLAKGLEFDHVIIPDAQASVYPDEPLARRQLYTAASRAMHRLTILSQGPMTTLLDAVRRAGA